MQSMVSIINAFITLWLFCIMLYLAWQYYPLNECPRDPQWLGDMHDRMVMSDIVSHDDELSEADIPLCMKVLSIVDLLFYSAMPAAGGTIVWTLLSYLR